MADTTSTCIKSSLPFPTELTPRVLAELDVEDVLTMQMVSKRLRTIAKERSLWTHLFHSCYAQLLPHAPLLEEPFEAYTARELERLVTHRSRQRKLWSGEYSGPLVSLIRLESRSPFRSSPASLLIRGGRWLLTVTLDKASVLVHDADSPLVKPKVLCVPPPLQESDLAGIRRTCFHYGSDVVDKQLHIDGIIYDIDDDSPTLQFNLCMRCRTVPGDSFLVFQIWRVALIGHGHDATLSATHTQTIVTVLSYRHYSIFVETLKKDYLLLTIKDRNSQAWQDRRALTILDWKRSTPTDLCTALIQVGITPGLDKYTRDGERLTSATLLPNNKVLCFTTSSAMLYDVPEFRLVPKGSFMFEGIQEVTQPLWMLRALLNGEDSQTIVVYSIPPLSPGSGEGDIIKALFSTDNGVYGLALQEENILIPPRLFRAIAFPEKFTDIWCVTPGAAFVACEPGPYATGGYACLSDDTVDSVDSVESSHDQWDALPSLPFEQESIAIPQYDTATAVYPVNLKNAAYLQYDDESGRLVMSECYSGGFLTIHVMEREWARRTTTALKMPSQMGRRHTVWEWFGTQH